jgi:hypothetical protein
MLELDEVEKVTDLHTLKTTKDMKFIMRDNAVVADFLHNYTFMKEMAVTCTAWS